MSLARAAGETFTTVRTEGGLLPSDILARIAGGDRMLDGLTPEAYHISKGERLNEVVSRSWNRMKGAWTHFQEAASKLPEGDQGTTVTRERWLLVLFQELGYGRLPPARGLELEGKTYPISHMWWRSPIHLVGFRVDLDRRSAGVVGAARTSPHGLVQEYLNRSADLLWGFVSNGHRLRILRDNVSLTRQAWVEFDLEAMMEDEVYPDFVLLWLLAHQSRVEGERPEECWLEKWVHAARDQGTRALESLRSGVEEAIRILGAGFLAFPGNHRLLERLRSGALKRDDYYRQLLRLVYRLLFLFVAENREVLLNPEADPKAKDRFLRYYSTARIRRLAERMRGTVHPDLYRGFKVIMVGLGNDEGCPPLGLPALGSFLWSREAIPDLLEADLKNGHLLEAVRSLAFTRKEKLLRSVDYKNLGAEELGSVYESLLELHPEVNTGSATFDLRAATGNERKTTGSYYTPESLVQCLLDSALDPVLDEAVRKPEPEKAILALKVCDPACGSGHFLIAAAHRIAKRLAAIRTGDAEPSPVALRKALRDVVGHSIYGVDLNPMAVELCKVSLWLEALEPGKPLSFLERRIVCGNSLLGTTPRLLEGGLPDEAFEVIEGDEKKVASALKKRNREERKAKGQKTLFEVFEAEEAGEVGRIAEKVRAVEAVDDSTIQGIRQKEELNTLLAQSSLFRNTKLVADAWCAAFVWKKVKDGVPAITDEVLARLSANPSTVAKEIRAEVERLTREYQFLHWHIAFPDVFRVQQAGEKPECEQAGWSNGFDVVLGNPPWEHTELKEKEWFATRRPEIAEAITGADRKDRIRRLAQEDALLHSAFVDAKREHDAIAHFANGSGRFPFCGRGRINTYAIFAETKRLLISPAGRVGAILPSGIATDDTTKFFFQDLVEKRSLASLYDFENREGLFPAVDSRMKFALVTLAGSGRPAKGMEFLFFAHRTGDLADDERRFELTPEDVRLLNPNTRTCPVFRSKRDAEITKAIYRRVPVLIEEGPPENPWGVSFKQGLFNMTSDSEHFRTREQLEPEGWRLDGNVFVKGKDRYLPLYEAKLIHHFDHRWATYKGLETRDLTAGEKDDPGLLAIARYWVPHEEVRDRLAGRWNREWLLGWRDICRSTDERTVIASVVPRVGVGDKFLLMFLGHPTTAVAALLGNLDCLAFDYCSRQKLGGTSLKYFTMKQLPVLIPGAYAPAAPWNGKEPLSFWLLPRVLELTYTAWDLEPFARDCGHDGPPFRWDPERRFLLRAELDAAFFHLYGINREDADYILDTFPIVRRNDEAEHGEYRTKRVILEIYDAMKRAMESGMPYRTLLDPPAADPRVAHPPREAAARPAKVASTPPLPFEVVGSPSEEDKYTKVVPLTTLKIAAGSFGESQEVEFDAWAEVKTARKLRPGMFVAQVTGRSMEDRIPDGSWCLFSSPVTGTRQGKIVLAQHRSIHDPDTGGSYTLKVYKSEKTKATDGTWRHARIVLDPLNPAFKPIELKEIAEDEVQVVAEFLEVL